MPAAKGGGGWSKRNPPSPLNMPCGQRKHIQVGALNRYNVANWRSHRETVHILAILRVFWGF